MQSVINLFNDVANNRLVEGLSSKTVVTLRDSYQGETLSFRIFPVVPIVGAVVAPFFSQVSVSNILYRMAIGARAGAESLLAAQPTWTAVIGPDADGLSNYLYADLNLNTTAMNTAIGSLTTLDTSFFELQFSIASAPWRVGYQAPFRITATVMDVSGAISLPMPAANYPTWEQVGAAFVRRVGWAGENFSMISQDGSKSGLVYWGDDGAFHSDAIS